MKGKKLFLTSIFVIGLFIANAQIVSKGDKIASFGLGLGNTLYSGRYYKSTLPPVSASLEVILKDGLLDGNAALGVGGYLGISSYKYTYNNWGWKYSNVIVGPRGYFHYNFLDKLDTYTGLLLGYNIVSAKEFGTHISGWNYNTSSGGMVWSWFIGGRYYFNENLAAMVELGYGISYMNIGIAIKLGKKE